MDKKSYNQMGKDIRDAVQNAVNSMDFSELNRQITQSVNEALSEVQEAFGGSSRETKAAGQNPTSEEEIRRLAREKLRQMEEEMERRRQAQKASQTTGSAGSTHSTGTGQSTRPRTYGKAHSPAVIASKPKGAVSGVVRTVFGGLLLGSAALMSLIFAGATAAGVTGVSLLAAQFGVIVVPAGGGGILMLVRGSQDRARVGRFRRYVDCLKDRSYVKVKELATAAKKSENYVRKDLEKMIRLEMFPQGHISGDQDLFVLDHKTYAQLETLRHQQEEKARRLQAESPEDRQLRETLERGSAYIQAIRLANDRIPGEEISRQLDMLEAAVDRIYTQIRKSPEKIPQLRKFQEYYLPTTLKLVEAYQELDEQPIAGENIQTAKAEIEASLDTIIIAFDRLFDSLFAETAMDVSTDISVLQTLLAQEGLADEAWRQPAKGAHGSMQMDQVLADMTLDTILEPETKTEPEIRLTL